MIYLELFLRFMYIGALTIGGGYAAMPIIQEQTVERMGWLTTAEFSDLITISEITPGPIAINSATFVGTKVAGIPGALSATLGFMVPPFIIISILYYFYNKYRSMDIMRGIFGAVRPAAVALIASAGLTILIIALWGEGGFNLAATDYFSLVLFFAAFVVLKRFKVNQIFVIFGCGVAGVISETIGRLLAA